MKYKFLNYILVSMVALTAALQSASAQTSQAEAKLHDYSIKIGEQTKLFLIVHQPANEHVTFPKLADSIVSKVTLVSTGKRDTTFEGSDRSRATVTQSYTITSFDAGSYTIPAFKIGTGSGVLTTNDVTLQVQSVKVDTTKSIYDIKQPFAVSYTFWDWLKDNWLWVLIGLLVVLLAVGITWYLVKRPKKVVEVKKIEPVIPIHTQAINKLQEIRAQKIWQRDVKQYYSELTDVLRDYLEKRYDVKTQEKTTEEIIIGLKRVQIYEDQRGRLHQVLVLADLVKFAKENPAPQENEQIMDYAIDFVVKTQQAPVIESKPTEGGSTDEPA